MPPGPPKLYIFDVDGTLRWTTIPGQMYPLAPGEWRLFPEVRERLGAIDWRSGTARLAVASNQNGVGGGLLSSGAARQMIADTLEAAIGYLPPDTIIEMCTHPLDIACECRKPAPGLLLRILAAAGIRGSDALFIGDLDIDEEAARRAGIPFAWAKDYFARA